MKTKLNIMNTHAKDKIYNLDRPKRASNSSTCSTEITLMSLLHFKPSMDFVYVCGVFILAPKLFVSNKMNIVYNSDKLSHLQLLVIC